MISVETYLSFVNYQGIGGVSLPNIVVAEAEPIDPAPVAAVAPPIRRTHWATRVQTRFSRWLSGKDNQFEGVSYTRDDLIAHLERQFTRGMTWDLYAGRWPYRTKRRTWVVDHIVPKRMFTAAEIEGAYALSNLRPMWMDDNFRKGNARVHLV